jgi:hypothetical protein
VERAVVRLAGIAMFVLAVTVAPRIRELGRRYPYTS